MWENIIYGIYTYVKYYILKKELTFLYTKNTNPPYR